MNPHFSELTLLAAGAGTLPSAHLHVMAAHAARCPACAAALRAAEAIGGALLEDMPPEALHADALARTLARLDTPAPPAPPPPALTLEALATRRWRRVAPGIAIMPLQQRDATGTRLDLIRVAPGLGLLRHGHAGLETTCVLQGGYADGSGEFHAGDAAEADPSVDHRPRALPGPDCICLIATTGHLRPHGVLGRLVRPLLGM